MIFAPVLQSVGARLAGRPTSLRSDPQGWAYALREAVTLVRPDWIVTHHDIALEARALEGIAAADLLDADVAALPGPAAALEVTATLAALFPRRTVAASLTGPGTVAAALTGPVVDDDLLTDCGDVLAALAAAHVQRGAGRILVWERGDGEGPAGLPAAHAPIRRRLDLLGVPGVLCGGPGAAATGYSAHARPTGGRGAVLLDPARLGAPPDGFAQLWRDVSVEAGEGAIVVTDGPVPGDADLAALREAAERSGAPA